MNDKIDGIEQELIEQYRRSRESLPETGDGWRENVVSAIAGIELSPGFSTGFLQPSLLFRFSGAAALASILMLVLYIAFGSSPAPQPSLEFLLDPVRSIGTEWLKGL